MPRKKLALVDGHAVAFRAFHALRDANLRTSTGEPTFAVFGFCQILLTTLQQLQPEYAAVAFDVGRTFRDELYAEYKAGRAQTPDDFHPQLARIKVIVQALNIPIYTQEGYEADDVIGTLARQATVLDVDTYIITGDSDTLQLVDEHVRVLLAVPYGKRQETKEYDLAAVQERYKGLRPHQLADLRGLKGDVSDNIPGVKGIGETGAITLLNQFQTIEGMYARLDEVPNRYRKVLDGQQEQAFFSKQLATIDCSVPVQLNLEQCRLAGYNRDAVIALFQELQFGSLVRKLPPSDAALAASPVADASVSATAAVDGSHAQLGLFDGGDGATAPTSAPSHPSVSLLPGIGTYKAVRTTEELQELVDQLRQAPAFAFDTETSGLGFLDAQVVGLSFAVQPGQGWYVPIGHQGAEVGPQLERGAVRDAVLPIFENGAQAKVAHNGKFDVLALRKMDINVRGLQFDTMIAATLLGNQGIGLKDLAFNILKVQMTEISELIGSGKQQITFDRVPIEQATAYAAADADLTLRLRDHLDQELDRVPRLRSVFETIEMPLLPVLADMEWHGIKVDVGILRQLGATMQRRLQELEGKIFEIAGGPFNIGSGQQLNTVLFDKLQVPTAGLSKTKTGLYSITAEVLDKLSQSGDYPIVNLILEHRQLTKLKSTYLDALPQLVDRNARVHTEYRQLGAATGRLSSNNPNLQNIPVRTEQGREIRRAFVAADGHYLLAADYSQIELRLLAHITQDPALVETFKEGRDIHAATAARLFGVPINQVSKNQRRIAKCVATGTLVSTNQGVIPIERLGQAPVGETREVRCIVAQEGDKRATATGFYNGGLQQTIRITTERGYTLEATPHHRVRSLDAEGNYIWRQLAELEVGHHVALARGAMLFGHDQAFEIVYTRRQEHKRCLQLPAQMTPVFARWLGYFVAEGNIIHGATTSSLFIHNRDVDVLDDLRRISAELFGVLPHESIDRNGVTKLSWHSSRLVELLEYLGVGCGAATKRIPDTVMHGSQETVSGFLRSFFEGDGSISGSFISAASKSYALIQQLQVMLLNLGIVCCLERRDVPHYGRHYKLRLLGKESRLLFAKHIGFISRRKQTRLQVLVSRAVSHEAITLPLQRERLRRLYPQTKRELKERIHTCIRSLSPPIELTYQRLGLILDGFRDTKDIDAHVLRVHHQRNLFYDRVASIEYSQQYVYDLVVPDTNTYIANGFVSHNTTVFGTIYGISSFGLAARTDLNRGEAQQLINGLFDTYPGLKQLFDETLEFGRTHGYVETLFGRRRYFGSGQSNALVAKGPGRAAAEREAINAPIQGTSADLIKMAMSRLFGEIQRRGLQARMLLQVHDELLLEVPDDELDEVQRLVKETMEGVYPELSVPLEVEVSKGRNWEEMG